MSFSSTLAQKLINYKSEQSYAFRLRRKRAQLLKPLINSCYKKYCHVKIIDIGGTRTYWNILPLDYLKRKNVHITIINLSSQESFTDPDGIFTFKQGNGCDLREFADNSFHIAHSNSVIEHVIGIENRIMFSEEIRRVAENYYIQTPNFWFPVEPHFVMPFYHWLPLGMKIKLLMKYNLGMICKTSDFSEADKTVKSIELLNKREVRNFFPEARIYMEKILGFNKSFVLIKNSLG